MYRLLLYNDCMITRISKSEYKRIKSLQRVERSWISGMIFMGRDGRAYQTNLEGAAGVKEVYEFQKGLIHEQGDMFALDNSLAIEK